MWVIVLNSSAGKGKALSLATSFITVLEQYSENYFVINEPDAEKTCSALAACLTNNQISRVIAVGGDGLVSLCIQFLAESRIPFCVIPAGTGNDFARSIGMISMTPQQLFQFFQSNAPSSIDLGRVQSQGTRRWFVQVLSTGFDSAVNSLANQMSWPRGKSKYTLALLKILSDFKPIRYEIEIDGNKLDQSAVLVTVANGKSYGGGMKICPNASITDGLFDILIVNPVSKFVLLTIFPKVFFGKHIPHRQIDTYRGKTVKISAMTSSYADGEFISNSSVVIENVSGALHTWVNK